MTSTLRSLTRPAGLLVAVLAGATAVPHAAHADGRVPAEAAATLAGTLQPDADAVREALFIDVYDCSIFTDGTGRSLIRREFSEPVTIRFDITTDMLPNAAPAPWQAALDPVLEPGHERALARAFRGFAAGDSLVFYYAPDAGTTVYANGDPLFETQGTALVRAVTDMLIGADPVSATMREALIEDLQSPTP